MNKKLGSIIRKSRKKISTSSLDRLTSSGLYFLQTFSSDPALI